MADSLGVWLRRSREARQLDLEDAVRALRIRRRYLQALELGDYEALPGPIQARGFLRNYARFLGLPVEDVLARYDAEIQGQPVQPRLPEVTTPVRQGMRNWAPPPPTVEEERAVVQVRSSMWGLRILIALMLFFGLVAVGSFLWLRFGVENSPTSTAGASGSPKAPTVSPVAVTSTVQPAPVFPVADDGLIHIRLVPLSHAWISVSADSTIVFQGIADPQHVVDAVGKEIVVVATGNGGAFRLYVNGTDWGLLGAQGEVVRRAWSPTGETSLEGL